MSADQYAAILIGIVALAMLACGIARHLRQDSATPMPPMSPRDPFRGMSERERHYHQSDQFGR